MNNRERIMDEIAQRPPIRSGTVVPRAAAMATAERQARTMGPIIHNGEPVGDYTELVETAKDLNPAPNGTCWKALENKCDGMYDKAIADEYCSDNCKACPRYEERRQIK